MIQEKVTSEKPEGKLISNQGDVKYFLMPGGEVKKKIRNIKKI